MQCWFGTSFLCHFKPDEINQLERSRFEPRFSCSAGNHSNHYIMTPQSIEKVCSSSPPRTKFRTTENISISEKVAQLKRRHLNFEKKPLLWASKKIYSEFFPGVVKNFLNLIKDEEKFPAGRNFRSKVPFSVKTSRSTFSEKSLPLIGEKSSAAVFGHSKSKKA